MSAIVEEFYPEAAPSAGEAETKNEPATLRGRLQDKVAQLGGGSATTEETTMFKVIGGVVVCGLALYGLVKYLERPVMNVVIRPERRPGSAEVGSDPSAPPAPQGKEGAPTEAMVAEAALG